MPDLNHLSASLAENWPVWLLSAALVIAAVIDGWKLKVPNWVTFPLIVSGWAYSTVYFGWAGLGWSLLGTAVGLGLLLPAYAIGGMGVGRRETAGRRGGVGLGHHHPVRLLRLGTRRRPHRRRDGPLAP